MQRVAETPSSERRCQNQCVRIQQLPGKPGRGLSGEWWAGDVLGSFTQAK